jgi:hypothetical protein
MIGILYAFIPNQTTRNGNTTEGDHAKELQYVMTVAMSIKRK